MKRRESDAHIPATTSSHTSGAPACDDAVMLSPAQEQLREARLCQTGAARRRTEQRPVVKAITGHRAHTHRREERERERDFFFFFRGGSSAPVSLPPSLPPPGAMARTDRSAGARKLSSDLGSICVFRVHRMYKMRAGAKTGGAVLIVIAECDVRPHLLIYCVCSLFALRAYIYTQCVLRGDEGAQRAGKETTSALQSVCNQRK